MKSRSALVLPFAILAHALNASAGPRAHGPAAASDQFPSHTFRLAAHQPEHVQLAFHYGLIQPILFHGFNAAVDVRYKRFIATYSHGQGLDVTSVLSDAERAAGASAFEPFTTGGGIGVLLIDELYVMADLKVHHFEIETPRDPLQSYTNITVGLEVGWRFFIWKGLNVGVVARYWPNVFSTRADGVALHDASGGELRHHPIEQGASGFFANVLVGWAFEL